MNRFLAGLLLAIMLALASVTAAPAPMAKPAPAAPALVPCSCVMTWQRIDCETHFHADGGFYCFWHGRWWQGTWAQKDGVLSVEERPLDEPASPGAKWKVKLSSPTAGVLDIGEVPWAIRLVAGGSKIG